MIVELIDLALDFVGDLAQFEVMVRFGWPRARAWVTRASTKLACLSFAAFEKGDIDIGASARDAADEELLELLSRVTP